MPLPSQRPAEKPAPILSAKYWGWLFGLVIVAATLAAYWPALRGDFIWDDDTHISTNRALRSAQGLWAIWFEPGATCQYYPLSFTVFWLGYHLWGLNPLGYHLQNVLLHGLVAVLLWQVLKRLEVRAAWLAGALFALHPVNVMSVAWMTELKNTLSGALVLGASWAYLRFARLGVYESRAPSGTDWRWGVLALALFQLAMFAKTAVSFLPLTLLLLVWWKRGRITWRSAWPVLVMLGIAMGMGLLTLHVEQMTGATGDEFRMSPAERVLVSGRSFWFYLGKLFFPYPLTFMYGRWKVDPGVWWQYAYPLATLGVLGSLWVMRNRMGRGTFAGLLHFYVATSFLVLIQVLYMMRYTIVSDHWQYFGCMSVLAIVAAGIDLAFDFVRRGRLLLKGAFCGTLLLILSVLTWRQCGMYANLPTLWQITLARNPNCWMAHGSLGDWLSTRGRPIAAEEHFRKAVEINPAYAEGHYNLANTLSAQGKWAEAIQHYEQALQLKPRYAGALNNLGIALTGQGRLAEAVQCFERAIEIRPDFARAQFNLGMTLASQGKSAEAYQHLEQALALATDQGNLAFAESIRAKLMAFPPSPHP